MIERLNSAHRNCQAGTYFAWDCLCLRSIDVHLIVHPRHAELRVLSFAVDGSSRGHSDNVEGEHPLNLQAESRFSKCTMLISHTDSRLVLRLLWLRLPSRCHLARRGPSLVSLPIRGSKLPLGHALGDRGDHRSVQSS